MARTKYAQLIAFMHTNLSKCALQGNKVILLGAEFVNFTANYKIRTVLLCEHIFLSLHEHIRNLYTILVIEFAECCASFASEIFIF